MTTFEFQNRIEAINDTFDMLADIFGMATKPEQYEREIAQFERGLSMNLF